MLKIKEWFSLKEHLSIDKLLLLIVLVLPWSNALCNILIVVLLSLFSFSYYNNRINIQRDFKIGFSFIFIFILVCALSIINLEHPEDGIHYLARISLIITIPLAIYYFKRRNSDIINKVLLKGYIHSAVILAFVTIVYGIFKWYTNTENLPIEQFLTYKDLARLLVNHQPIYFSLFIGFGGILSFSAFLNSKKNKTKGLYLSECIFLLAFIFLLGARTAIVSTLICIAIMAFKSSKKALLILGLTFSLLFAANYSYNNTFKTRVDYLLEFTTDFDYHSSWSYEGLAFRFMTWNCSIEVIKNNFWFGTGISGAQEQLDACYYNNSYDSLIYFIENDNTKFNSHNLFLEVFVTTGLLGVLILSAIFIYYLIFAIKKSKFLLIIFIAYFLLNGLTESLFIREKGILFFAIFLGILSNLDNYSKPHLSK
jgi:O-antigen ligase